MRMRFRGVLFAMAGLFFGCDSAPSTAPPAVMVGPHRGTTIRLPDDKGYVELTNEPEVSGRGSREPTAIVAYFLKPDGTSSLEPAPSDVRLSVTQARTKDTETIPLAAEPKADDPAGGSRFASKPGPHHLAVLRGQLNAKIDGQEVSLPVSGSR
jgi:hypothetical protein